MAKGSRGDLRKHLHERFCLATAVDLACPKSSWRSRIKTRIVWTSEWQGGTVELLRMKGQFTSTFHRGLLAARTTAWV
jgi:hypothetical protein